MERIKGLAFPVVKRYDGRILCVQLSLQLFLDCFNSKKTAAGMFGPGNVI